MDRLELQVQIELMENQLVFTRLGFVKTVEFSHPGYTQITEVTMQKILATTKLTWMYDFDNSSMKWVVGVAFHAEFLAWIYAARFPDDAGKE